VQPEELDAIADTIVETVKAHTAPLAEQVAALTARDAIAGPPGPPGADGRDGVDAPPVDVHAVAKQAAALMPVPKDGRDGTDADVELIAAKVLASVSAQIAELVAQEVTKAVSAIEKPKDGRDGVDGKDGQSVTLDQIAGAVAAEVTKAVEALPAPKDGAPGRDGVGVAGALVDQAGNLVLTLSNGAMQPLGTVVGAKGDPGRDGVDGRHGKDGADGFGFDDITVEHDGERTLSLTFRQGERVKSFPVTFPVQIHRGVFDVTKTYERGDCSTWGGSTWQAVRPTSGLKPGDGPAEKTGWVLVTKAGRDGRSGKDGEPGKPGRDGKDGGPKW
jgi:ketosteroid isomerase-like protein